MKHLPLLLICSVLVAVCIQLTLGLDGAGDSAASASFSNSDATTSEVSMRPLGEASGFQGDRKPRSPDQLETRSTTDLRGDLLELAAMDLGDTEQLEAFVRPLLLDPAQVRAALALLISGKLKTHPDVLSQEEIGAIRLVLLALSTYSSPTSLTQLFESGLEIDGRAFTEEVLRALASIEDPAATTLARNVAGVRIDGAALIDVSYLALLRTLVVQYPDRERMYGIFLALIGIDSGIAFDLQFLSLDEDPQVLKSHLTAAFAKADAAQALMLLKWVEEAYSQAEAEMQSELALAIASAAPPDLAAGFLAERAGPKMLAQFDLLGTRPGGLEGLSREYNNLLTVDANPTARKMIVSGLSASGTEALLGIAETDPDPGVRGQAVLSSTWAADFQPNAAFLEKLRASAADTFMGAPPYATIATAQNLLQGAARNGDTSLASKTAQFLQDMALDTTVPAYDRAKIPAILKNHMSENEWESFRLIAMEVGPQ